MSKRVQDRWGVLKLPESFSVIAGRSPTFSQNKYYEENSNYIHGFDIIVNVQDVIILKVRNPKPKQTIKLK